MLGWWFDPKGYLSKTLNPQCMYVYLNCKPFWIRVSAKWLKCKGRRNCKYKTTFLKFPLKENQICILLRIYYLISYCLLSISCALPSAPWWSGRWQWQWRRRTREPRRHRHYGCQWWCGKNVGYGTGRQTWSSVLVRDKKGRSSWMSPF